MLVAVVVIVLAVYRDIAVAIGPEAGEALITHLLYTVLKLYARIRICVAK